jgi:hypothetical protein
MTVKIAAWWEGGGSKLFCLADRLKKWSSQINLPTKLAKKVILLLLFSQILDESKKYNTVENRNKLTL